MLSDQVAVGIGAAPPEASARPRRPERRASSRAAPPQAAPPHPSPSASSHAAPHVLHLRARCRCRYGVPGNTGDVNIVSIYASDTISLIEGGGLRLSAFMDPADKKIFDQVRVPCRGALHDLL